MTQNYDFAVVFGDSVPAKVRSMGPSSQGMDCSGRSYCQAAWAVVLSYPDTHLGVSVTKVHSQWV